MRRIAGNLFCCVALACTVASGPCADALQDPSPQDCTAFCLPTDHGPILAKNYDFTCEAGLLLVNTQGAAKKGFDTDRPAKWISRYGSVTFTQYSRDFAWGGMNEAGLVIEGLAILKRKAMEYPDADARPAIRQGQWIQYQLDTAATVDDILSSDSLIRIENRPRPIVTAHYLVCDARGDCAVVEFIGGKMVARRGKDLAVRALTNTKYAELADKLEQYDRRPGPLPSAREMVGRSLDDQSVDRFLHAASMVRAYTAADHGSVQAYALGIMEAVRCDNTQWRILYDVPARRVRWRTASTPAEKFLDLASVTFSNGALVLCMSVPSPVPGNVRGALVPWTHDLNTKFMRAAGAAAFAGAGKSPEGLLGKAMDQRIRMTAEFIEKTCPPQKELPPPPKTTGDAANPVKPQERDRL